MMDISDGIGSDLRHIMEESGVGMEVEMARIPVSEQLQAYCRRRSEDLYRFAASGGEDYELLFTVAPEAESTLAVEHFVIGRVTEGSELVWKGSKKDYDGFRHF